MVFMATLKITNKNLTFHIINNLAQRNTHIKWFTFWDLNIIPCVNEKIRGNPLDPNLTHYKYHFY